MGTLPTQIGLMTAMRATSLSDNSITGTLPTQIGLMTAMESYFDLSDNSITGTLPTQIGLMTAMESSSTSTITASRAPPDADRPHDGHGEAGSNSMP